MTTGRSMLVAAGLAFLTAAGCEPAERPDDASNRNVPAATADPAALGTLAARLYAEPERGEAILEEHGMSRAELDRRVWEVAEDPDASEAYTRAMEVELDRLGVEEEPDGG